MAIKNPTLKVTASLQTFDPQQGAQTLPDNVQMEFSVERRIEKQLYNVPSASSVTVTAASEGVDDSDLVKVEIVTPGKPAEIVMNGAATAFTIKPVTATGKAFMIFSGNFVTLTVQNPDLAVAIDFVISIFKKQPGT